jgi:acyl-CoA thioesterase
MDDVKQFVDNDRLARHLGIEILEHADGMARGRMEVKAHHLNSAGTLHGGAIFSLADSVFAAASNSRGSLAMAVSADISFFRAVTSGIVTAVAEEVSFHPKLATYLVSVHDEQGNRIALFRGTVYRKKEPLPVSP